MQIHRDIDNLPSFKNAVITIGTFDGVHTGHQQIIQHLKQEAKQVNGETVIITFHPHPRKIVSVKKIFILNTLEEKIELLRAEGIDHLVVVPFDENFARQPSEVYAKNFLYQKFHPHSIIIGYDHRFGKEREGDYHLLEDYGKEYGFIVKEIPGHLLHKAIVSSTKIREALLSTDISTANESLGYPYFFEGLVVDGNKLGRTLGYPTANLQIENEEKLIPGNGIYSVDVLLDDERKTMGDGRKTTDKGQWLKDNGQWTIVDGQWSNNNQSNPHTPKLIPNPTHLLSGMMSIGIRPTINGKERVIEVNIFDFDTDIYGRHLRVYVKKYLREEIKFDSLEDLKIQIGRDKEDAMK